MNDKLEKLKKVLELANEDYLKYPDFLKFLSVMKVAVENIRTSNEKDIESKTSKLQSKLEDLTNKYSQATNETVQTRQEVAQTKQEIQQMLEKAISTMQKEVQAKDGKDGKDAEITDEFKDEVVQTVLSTLKFDTSKQDKEIEATKKELKRLDEIERIAKANAMPVTTMFVNGQRAKNITFGGAATVEVQGDTAVVGLVQGSGVVNTVNGVGADDFGNVELTSDDITEGTTNLYFNQTTFDTYFGEKTTDNLTQGVTNLYNQTHTGDVTGSVALTIANSAVTDAKVATGIDAAKLADGTVSNTEFQYINSLTSNAQTQINAKAPTASPTFTGTVTIPTPFTLGAVSVTATGTELNYVDGVTSSIQTQLDGKVNDTGDETIAGVKTFSSIPVLPASDPTTANQATRKSYVDAALAGIDPSLKKFSVRVATLVAGTLATSFENGDTIDGVVLATGDRILIKNQASASENGIYTVNASGAPTRATDSDTAAEVAQGTSTYVAEGTQVGIWLQIEVVNTLNTDPLTYTLITSVTEYTFTEGTSGTDFNISESGTDITFNIPTASATNRGALSSANWSTFNGKVDGAGTVTANSLVTFSGTGGKTIQDTDMTLYSLSSVSHLDTGTEHLAITSPSGTGLAVQAGYFGVYTPTANELDLGGNVVNVEASTDVNITSGNSSGNITVRSPAGAITLRGDADYIKLKWDTGLSSGTVNLNQFSVTGTKTFYFPNSTMTFAGIDISNSWADGVKQTFNPDGTNAGINVGSHTADPSSLANGDLWYNSTDNALRARVNGTTLDIDTGGAGIDSADIQVFNYTGSSQTWNKPSGAKRVRIEVMGGGGGGGSGRKGAAGTARVGGGGGASSSWGFLEVPAAILGSTETVTVGAGGAGGASQTINSTSGNAGSAGGLSSFGSWLRIVGGNGGAGGGSGAGGTGGTSPTDAGFPASRQTNGVAGSAASVTGGTGSPGASSKWSGASGASGGGITAANVASPGGTGGNFSASSFGGYGGTVAGGTAGAINTAGGNGNNIATNVVIGGTGGGGGGSSITTNAGAGGNGGTYGAGGGGGGAATNSVGNSGAGGNGANGIVIVTTYF